MFRRRPNFADSCQHGGNTPNRGFKHHNLVPEPLANTNNCHRNTLKTVEEKQWSDHNFRYNSDIILDKGKTLIHLS